MKNKTKKHRPEAEAFERIMEVIDYGKTFRWEELCEWLSVEIEKAKNSKCWEFLTPWLKLREMLSNEGYITTEQGMRGEGFRILTRHEMADYVRKKELKAADDSLNRSLTLSKVPRTGLNEIEIKKLDYWEQKSAIIRATSKFLVRKRELPSPEMFIKSIKQIS